VLYAAADYPNYFGSSLSPEVRTELAHPV